MVKRVIDQNLARKEVCVVCKTSALRQGGFPHYAIFDCPRCGSYSITSTAEATLPRMLDQDPVIRRSLMSHALRRMQRPDGEPAKVDEYNCESFWDRGRLPTPQEMADTLILWIGNQQRAPTEYVGATHNEIGGTIGLPVTAKGDLFNWTWLNEQLIDSRLYDWDTPLTTPNRVFFQLTMAGWHKYETLKKVAIESRTAFMALKFGQADLNKVVAECFRPAVARTGFELRLLTDRQPAGLIDDQLRAAILASRFVISDLTHGSHGAYWEAGFAEGLGLPVIYTCEKGAWEAQKTHFDTNHMVTIIWDLTNQKKAEDSLVDTIRATLRAEAKQTD